MTAMLQAIREFYKQFDYNAYIKEKFSLSDSPGRLYYSGMGGSALPADLVNDYLYGSFHLPVVRDYPFLKTGKNDFSILASYSGNTEEVLSHLDQTLESKIRCVVMAHGGALEQKAKAHHLPFVKIPDCIQPRCAAGYFFTAILGVLEQAGKISPQGESLISLSRFLKKRRAIHEQEGKELAHFLKGFVPIVYGPTELFGTCRFWKIKFNENSKIPSFFNVFPELNHNEMVGWTNSLMTPCFVFLKSQFMHPRNLKRMEVMKEMFTGKIPVREISLEGESRLQEIFDALAVADHASYELALHYGVDPAAVEMVEEFKKKLG
jgi:glucose/mannose-6-phosphate isomerase